MEEIFRDLTKLETKRASTQIDKRTKSEKVAYWLLPDCMKTNVERNPAIAFDDCRVAYFPDLFFREEKICVEIDGEYHKRRVEHDAHRDSVFAEHGYTTIRIYNEDTDVNVAFWQRLLEGMERIEIREGQVENYIKELHEMINKEIYSWTEIE